MGSTKKKEQRDRLTMTLKGGMREEIEKYRVERGQPFDSIVRALVEKGMAASDEERSLATKVLAAITQLPTLEQIEATVAGADSRAECAIAFIRALWEGEEPEVACVLRIANALEVDPQEFREWMRGIIASRADRASRSE